MRVDSLLLSLFLSVSCLFLRTDAHGGHTHGHRGNNWTYCGTKDLEPADMKRITDIQVKKKARAYQARVATSVTVDTYFVVLTDTSGYPSVPDSQLAQQVAVLNQHYANSESIFQFQIQGATTRLTKSDALTANLTEYLDSITFNYRRGGLDALNIFVVPLIQFAGNEEFIGYTFRFFTEGVTYRDGVFIVYDVLPSGGLQYYDNGVTGVHHEVGHWFGLVHTFQVNSPYLSDPCNVNNPNDYIADTPTQYSATTFCPSFRDSCPDLPGYDPIQNYMDYGYLYYPSTSQQYGLYVFAIFNYYGLGIASPGYYAVTVNGQLTAKGGQDFTYSKYIDFGSPGATPDPSSTSSHRPTVGGTTLSPTITASPRATISPSFSPTVHPTNKPTTRPVVKPVVRSIRPITPTKPIPTAPSGPIALPPIPSSVCYSDANTVQVKDKGVVAIKDLQIGDLVESSDGKIVNVYSFGHYQRNVKANYLQVHAQGLLQPLEISKDHLVFVNGTAMPASLVSIGDLLDLGPGRGAAKVTNIKVVTRSGAYAPFTTSGTIMVSGVLASSYVTLQQNSSVLMIGSFKTIFSMHWLAHLFQTPHRLACSWRLVNCTTETFTENGVSKWVEVPFHVCRWLVRQNVVVMAAVLIPAFLLLVALRFIEVVFSDSCFALVAAICGYAAVAAFRCVCRKSKAKTV